MYIIKRNNTKKIITKVGTIEEKNSEYVFSQILPSEITDNVKSRYVQMMTSWNNGEWNNKKERLSKSDLFSAEIKFLNPLRIKQKLDTLESISNFKKVSVKQVGYFMSLYMQLEEIDEKILKLPKSLLEKKEIPIKPI